jgi:hypothetical protein
MKRFYETISLSALVLTFVISSLSYSTEYRDIKFPDQITIDGKNLSLNGIGIRQKTIFNVNVYLAALYLPERSHEGDKILDSEQTKRMDIVFLRDVDAHDIVNAWQEGFAKNCFSECETIRPQLDRLNSLMVDVKNRQTVSFVFRPGGLSLTTPQREPVTFAGRIFSRMMLATFIGKFPPSETLKKGLLGTDESIPIRALASPEPNP